MLEFVNFIQTCSRIECGDSRTLSELFEYFLEISGSYLLQNSVFPPDLFFFLMSLKWCLKDVLWHHEEIIQFQISQWVKILFLSIFNNLVLCSTLFDIYDVTFINNIKNILYSFVSIIQYKRDKRNKLRIELSTCTVLSLFR